MDYNRIKMLCQERGVKISYLENKLGVWKGFFNNASRGKVAVNPNQLQIIADTLGTSVEYITGQTDDPSPVSLWLSSALILKTANNRNIPPEMLANAVGPDNMERLYNDPGGVLVLPQFQAENLAALLRTDTLSLAARAIPDEREHGVKIKVFGDVAAGIPIDQIDNFDPDDVNSWEEIDRRTAKNGTYFALRIKGNSMEPRMFAGDIVIVRWQPTVETGDIAIVAVNGDTATCKKVRIDEKGIYLIPLNTSGHEVVFFTNEEIVNKPITILGKVVEVRGKV